MKNVSKLSISQVVSNKNLPNANPQSNVIPKGKYLVLGITVR